MRRSLLVLLVCLATLAAACGGNDETAGTTANDGPATTSTSEPATSTTSVPSTSSVPSTTNVSDKAGFPVIVSSEAGEVTIPSPPERIAALSATHVEMLYAIGAGEALVAGDLFSNHPEQAATLEQIDSFNLSVESLVALQPDLVILSFDPVDAVGALDALGIPTLLLGTAPSLDGVYDQIATLGAATGRVDEAADLIDVMQQDIDAILADAGGAGAGLTYYHETDPFSFYTPNSSSFIGQLYGLLGLENIADAAPDEFGSGFPQLSPEYIVSADPDLVFLAAAGESIETLAARDGWGTMQAIADGDVVTLDPDIASRWGPRVVELLDAIAAAVTDT